MAQKKITELQLRSSVSSDLNFPSDDTLQSYRVTASQIFDFVRSRIYNEPFEVSNLTITTAVGSSALTIALKTKAGTDATSIDKIRVGFRSATLTSGSFVTREITGALSLVISSGSTLGQISAQPSRIWVYLIDNAGVPELAVSHSWYSEDALVSTTAEGGAGAADSATVVYSTTARSSVALRLIGCIDNTQTTAGTWASAGTKIQLMPTVSRNKPVITVMTSSSGTFYPQAGTRTMLVVATGGASSGGTNAADPALGADTTFGSLTATRGGTASGGIGPTGGVPTGGDINIAGGDGTTGNNNTTTAAGTGGASFWGGGGKGGQTGAAGQSAACYGAGGGGGATSGNIARAGGAAGGTAIKLYNDPVGSFAWAVGAGGSGVSGAGDGKAGVIFIIEI